MITIGKERWLKDGIYDIGDIDFIDVGYVKMTFFIKKYDVVFTTKQENIAKPFIEKYPDFVIGEACGTDQMFILSRRPDRAKLKHFGSGFNYGSTNIIQNCPKNILILAEND